MRTFFVFCLLIISFPGFAQDVPMEIEQSWKRLAATYQRRGDLMVSIISSLNPQDTTNLKEVKKALSDLKQYAANTEQLDSIKVNKLTEFNARLVSAMTPTLILLEKENKNDPAIQRRMNDLVAAENRSHTARIQYNELCEKLNRKDLQLQKQVVLK